MSEYDLLDLDPAGVKAVAEVAKIAVEGVVDGITWLGEKCDPVAREFSLLLRDKIRHYRAANFTKVMLKTQKMLVQHPDAATGHPHPRLAAAIFQHGSWADDEPLQDMWAGLLASAFTEDGRDESNLVFINILSQLTSTEATILNHCCEHSTKYVTLAGWVAAEIFTIERQELTELTGIEDRYRLERELDHLRSLGLIHLGFQPGFTWATPNPSALALHMYMRCNGFTGSPVDYFKLTQRSPFAR